MSGLTIPNDWDETTFCHIVVKVPRSTRWVGLVSGAILNLSLPWQYDNQTGDTAEASELGLDVWLSLEQLDMFIPEFVLFAKSSSIFGVSNSGTKLQLGTVVHDPYGAFNNSVWEWTVHATGVYLIEGFLQMDQVTDGEAVCSMQCHLNGTSIVAESGDQQNGGIETDWIHVKQRRVLDLTAGDVIYWSGWQSDAASRNIQEADDCAVWVRRIA